MRYVWASYLYRSSVFTMNCTAQINDYALMALKNLLQNHYFFGECSAWINYPYYWMSNLHLYMFDIIYVIEKRLENLTSCICRLYVPTKYYFPQLYRPEYSMDRLLKFLTSFSFDMLFRSIHCLSLTTPKGQDEKLVDLKALKFLPHK